MRERFPAVRVAMCRAHPLPCCRFVLVAPCCGCVQRAGTGEGTAGEGTALPGASARRAGPVLSAFRARAPVFPCSAICITFMSLFSLFNQYIFRPVKIVYLWLELHTSSFFHHH